MLSSVSLRTPLRFLLLLASLILLSSNSALGQESQAIGRVVTATGMVTASDQAGVTRELQRRSDIFVGDTITTGPAGFTQLRMVDSAQISFKEDTVFTFEAYNSDGPGGAPDNALMNMVQGGFRTISGTIGDDAGDDYEISTQFASIGIRGTTHEAVIDAGSLLTGVYDGGTTIANAQGTLNTGEDANFNYSQTFPGQAPQGLLQQPVQLGQININQQGGDDDADDDGDDNNADDGANDGDDGDDGGDGGLADADDEEPATRPLGNQQGDGDDPEQRFGIAGNNDPDTDLDPTNDTRTEGELNPVIDVRNPDDFENTGTGVVDRGDDPDDPGFIQPSEDFLALVANSGFNTDFSLSELAGTTGRVSQVLAFNGLADTGGISAQAVGDNGPTTPITALNMSFDLNFSASLGQVSNGLLEIRMDDAPTPIAFNIFFNGTIQNSVADFIIASNSNRIQGNSSTAIDTSVSFLDGILVDDGTSQALFSEFFFQDTQGLAVEGETLVGFASPVLSPADRNSISDRVGFLLSRNAAPGAIFPGNVTALEPNAAVILAGSDPDAPFSVSLEPPYVFRGAGSFVDFTDGSITQQGENPYNFEIGVWDSARLYEDFADNSLFEDIDEPLLIVSVDPASLSTLTGSRTYVTNFDRILGGSSQGSITEFFTAFDVDFSSALITNGVMQFCLGGGEFCTGSNAQYWDFDYSGSVIDGYVVAAPVNNTGYINRQLASIYGSIQGVFTGDNGEAFVGGFNLFYDADLDQYINQVAANALNIPDTTVDGVFLIEEEQRFSAEEVDGRLDNDSFLVQESYARILLGYSRPTTSDPILFVDQRSRPRLVLRDDDESISIDKRNFDLEDNISEAFGIDWERWTGTLIAYDNNLDGSSVLIDAAVSELPADPVSFFTTFRTSEMTEITGHYNHVLGFLGENEEGDPISFLNMSFDINFSASINNITNGELSASVFTETWRAFFEGGLNRNIVEFNLLAENPNNPGEMSGIYCDGLCSNLDLEDSNLQGAIVDDGLNPALLASFYLREEISDPMYEMYRQRLSGLALVAREDPRFAFIRDTEDRPVQQSSLSSLGFFMAMDPNNSNIDYITPVRSPVAWNDDNVFAEIDPDHPLYPLGFGDIFTAGLDPDDEVLDESAVGIDGLFDTYGFSWGIWQEPESGAANGPRVYTNPGDPSEFMLLTSGDGVDETVDGPVTPATAGQLWGLVNEPVISTYDGQVTYSHFLNNEGFFALGSGPGWIEDDIEVTDLDFAFDVDFSNGLVSNGFLHLDVDVIDVESQVWKSTFAGMVRDGYFQSSNNTLNIFEEDGSTLISDNTEGSVQGVFGGGDGFLGGTEKYPAFFGGFNFADLDNDTALTGVFISEVNPQHSAAQLRALAETYEDWYQDYNFTRALVNIPNSGEIGLIDKAGDDPIFYTNSLGGFNNALYGISSEQLNSDEVEVFFHAYDYFDDYYNDECDCYLNYTYFNGIQFEQTISEHAGFSHFDENSFQLSEEPFDLDLGYWTGSEGVFEAGALSTFYDEEDCPAYSCVSGFDLEQSSFESPAYWINYTNDNDISLNTTGRISTVLESFGNFRLTDSEGELWLTVPVEKFISDVLVNFYYSEISGEILAISAAHNDLAEPLEWSIDFNDADLSDPYEGDISTSFFISNSDGETTGSVDTHILMDITGTNDQPILVGSYQSSQELSEAGAIEIAGVFAAQQSRIGLVVETSQMDGSTLIPGSVSFGMASRPVDEYGDYSSTTQSPGIGLNFDQNGDQDIANIDLLPGFDVVITGASTLDDDFGADDPIETNIGYYSGVADWGYWDSENMSVIHNQMNSSLNTDDSILWANVQPASLASLEGTWSYYGYDAIGQGNLIEGGNGKITDFSMNFTVDFDTGEISNGNFMAELAESDTWAMIFEGEVDGIFAEMNNFDGTFNGRPIQGEMEAVFTGTGSELYQSGAMTGFSLFNDLGDHIDGLGFLHGGD